MKGYSLNSTAPLCAGLPGHCEKGRGQTAGAAYTGCETLPETGSRYQIQFSIIKDVATLYLDTSGEGLYKRGYRARTWARPCGRRWPQRWCTLSRYRGKDPFCDPFCGSGTIPIEAALIAKNRAPGLDRSFAAQKWKNMPARLWLDAGGGGHGQGVPRRTTTSGAETSIPPAVELAPSQRGAGRRGGLHPL